jgi:hypothetical protein
MMPTPPVRADGLCLTCGGPRGTIPKVLVKRSAHDLRVALETDPFCSSTCARSYYGTSLPAVSTGNRAPKTPRPIAPIPHGTDSGYSNRGCRCDRCRDAANEARRVRRRQTA